MVKKIKEIIFKCLPVTLQQKIVLKKTGVEVFKDVKVSSKIRFDFGIKPNDTLWKNRLSSLYGHEPLVVEFYEKHVKSQDVVFDIGAQFGYFPSIISAINPAVNIHCFEASWFSLHYLKYNKGLNDKQNTWTINHCFVTKSKGIIENTPAISINDYCTDKKIVPTLLQMDVDGEEFDIMLGASSLIGNGVTEFLIEVHPVDLRKKGTGANDFLNLFKADNLTIKYLPNFREQNTKWTSEFPDIGEDEEFYIYVSPKSRQRF